MRVAENVQRATLRKQSEQTSSQSEYSLVVVQLPIDIFPGPCCPPRGLTHTSRAQSARPITRYSVHPSMADVHLLRLVSPAYVSSRYRVTTCVWLSGRAGQPEPAYSCLLYADPTGDRELTPAEPWSRPRRRRVQDKGKAHTKRQACIRADAHAPTNSDAGGAKKQPKSSIFTPVSIVGQTTSPHRHDSLP